MTEITFKGDMDVELVDSMGTDETVARAARVSTGKDQIEQGKIEGLINHLVGAGHSSTYEHCYVTFRLSVPLFVREQIMTHRTLNKNNQSGRYTAFEPVFYLPSAERPLVNSGTSARPNLVHDPLGRVDMAVQNALRGSYSSAWDAYNQMLQDGAAKEVARTALPVGTYTSLWVTGNLHAWFNFLRLRNGTNGHPQWEIVEVAKKVEAIIAELYPITYAAWMKTL